MLSIIHLHTSSYCFHLLPVPVPCSDDKGCRQCAARSAMTRLSETWNHTNLSWFPVVEAMSLAVLNLAQALLWVWSAGWKSRIGDSTISIVFSTQTPQAVRGKLFSAHYPLLWRKVCIDLKQSPLQTENGCIVVISNALYVWEIGRIQTHNNHIELLFYISSLAYIMRLARKHSNRLQTAKERSCEDISFHEGFYKMHVHPQNCRTDFEHNMEQFLLQENTPEAQIFASHNHPAESNHRW